MNAFVAMFGLVCLLGASTVMYHVLYTNINSALGQVKPKSTTLQRVKQGKD